MAAPMNVQGLQADGAMGCDYGARKTDAVGISTSVAIPRGLWVVETDAHVIVRHQTDGAGTYVTWVPISSVAIVWSDGYALEWRGDGTGGNGIRTLLRAVSPVATSI